MGLLDSFMGILPEEGSAASNNLLDVGQALGMSLLQGNRQQPFANVAQNMAVVQQGSRSGMSKAALKQLLIQKGYTEAEADKYATSETATKLALQAKEDEGFQNMVKGGFGIGGTPAISPAAPAGPAAGVSLNGGGLTGDIGAFAGAIKAKESGGRYDIVGPTHPKQGRALGAYQVMEANLPQWSREALGREVSPDEFLKSPEIQDAIFAKKFGDSVQKYGNPQDAASVWFTGRPAAEGAGAKDVLGTTGANYVASFNANLAKQRPTQVADASGAVPGMNPAIAMPNGRPQVAENEQQTQALEGRMNMYPPSVYGVTAPAQVAQADLPAPGSAEAGFEIPPGQGAQPAPRYGPDTTTGRAIAARQSANSADEDRQIQEGLAKIAMSGRYGEKGKAYAEAIKLQLQPLLENRKRTDVEKLADAAGLDGEARQQALSRALPGNANTSLQKEYGTYSQQEIAAGRQPLSQFDYDVALSRAKANNVTVGGAEKTYDADQGKTYSGLMTEFQAAGRKAPSTLATLNEAERLMNTPGFTSGIGTEKFILPFKQVAARLGGDPNAPAAMETVRALANKAVTDQLGGSLGAGVSNADVSFLQKQNASLDNSVDANRTLIGYAKKLAERNAEVAGRARDYAKRNGGRLDVGFEQELAEWVKANPVFPEAAADTALGAQGSNVGAQRGGAPAYAAPKVETATDRAQTISNAKAYVAKNPAKRDAVIKALRDQGIPTDAL